MGVKQVCDSNHAADRERNEYFLREMDKEKAEADTQLQSRTNIRCVQDAYTKRLSPVNWEAYTLFSNKCWILVFGLGWEKPIDPVFALP